MRGEVVLCGFYLMREDLMAAPGLAIRGDMPAVKLRALARRERSRSAAARMYAVANALEGMARAKAARLAGLERQGKSPRELMTGQGHAHWLTLLGLGPLQPQRA